MKPTRPLSPAQGWWLLVFAVEATQDGSGRSHQLGAIALGLLFSVLLIGEVRSSRSRR